jgi:transcription-repair coupling factor (superfamily II helicase)
VHQIYHHSCTASFRIFFLGHSINEEKTLYITDKEDDIETLKYFGYPLTGKPWQEITTLWDFLAQKERENGYFFMHANLLKAKGNMLHIERNSVLHIERNMVLKQEDFIMSLTEVGYTHELGARSQNTYEKKWSIISITANTLWLSWDIEWFDTEVDSIVEREHEKRTYRNTLILPKKIETIEFSEKLNEELLECISWKGVSSPSKWTRTGKVIISGCDFLEEREKIVGKAEVHFADFTEKDGISLEGFEYSETHIDALVHLLKDEQTSIHIYTRYEKTLADFLEFHIPTYIQWKGNSADVSRTVWDWKSSSAGTKADLLWTIQWKGNSADVSRITLHPIEKRWLISSGGVIDGRKHIVIADDILGPMFVRRREKKSLAKNLDLLLQIKPWDYVVHREHGIALFFAVVKKALGEIEREYIELHYAENDKLFVPLTELYRISKYLGENNPELTRLSGKEWEKTMEKTEEEINAIALDIIETSAKRTLAKGRAFAIFREKEELFRKAFPYEHTHDQIQAIQEIFEDMEKDEPMDRLISWDVGFGKTEVAMNAIYKAVLSGTQVIVISPLLVLADEHYETFIERLSPFGVSIGILTRMQSDAEVRGTLDKLKNGTIDVVVGTHRLLSDDVLYKKLGLLIIDEEHRFGVSQKEKIKKIRSWVDILSLSATPIPRSLNLALSGLKKISILASAPKKRKPIETIVLKWNERAILDAYNRERERGGQMIILYNRVRGIESIENEIRGILSQSIVSEKMMKRQNGGSGEETVWVRWKKEDWWATRTSFSSTETFGTFGHKSTEESEFPKIVITHGQMNAEMMEERIHAFKKWEYDILLSTTIIENGVNFLGANTIIIIDPEDFWLASLHQLRWRVGRKDLQWYCYLMYRKGDLSKDEKERLITIANHRELGAGFEIAMRDMELRWAGEVLGIKQAGKSKDIWLTLYFRMLEERISELKEEKKKRTPTKIELELSYTLPESLFSSEEDRLHFYREIENIETLDELEEVEAEFFKEWELSKEQWTNISHLFLLLRVRLTLAEYGVKKLSRLWVNYVFEFEKWRTVEEIKRFLERFDRHKDMVILSLEKVRVETKYYKNVVEFLEGLV